MSDEIIIKGYVRWLDYWGGDPPNVLIMEEDGNTHLVPMHVFDFEPEILDSIIIKFTKGSYVISKNLDAV